MLSDRLYEEMERIEMRLHSLFPNMTRLEVADMAADMVSVMPIDLFID